MVKKEPQFFLHLLQANYFFGYDCTINKKTTRANVKTILIVTTFFFPDFIAQSNRGNNSALQGRKKKREKKEKKTRGNNASKKLKNLKPEHSNHDTNPGVIGDNRALFFQVKIINTRR